MRSSGSGTKGLSLSVRIEHWPIRGTFTISRGSKNEAIVVVAEILEGPHTGRGECVPYARYGESVDGVASAIEGMRAPIEDGLDRNQLATSLPAGAARNAIDCALWDLEAKRTKRPVHTIAGLPALHAVPTAFTISLGDPETMAAQAKAAAEYRLLKLKLGGGGDVERLTAVRAAAPRARLIVDANEAWDPAQTEQLLAAAAELGVELVEQPLPVENDAVLAEITRHVPVCADESVHARLSLDGIESRYDAVNIKLDKSGGLSEALVMCEQARARGLKTMVGSMVATSLAMAPALLIAQNADWVDLDGPLLLASDRDPALAYKDGLVFPPSPGLWG